MKGRGRKNEEQLRTEDTAKEGRTMEIIFQEIPNVVEIHTKKTTK